MDIMHRVYLVFIIVLAINECTVNAVCRPKNKCKKKCGSCIASFSCDVGLKEIPRACKGNGCSCCAPQVCCKQKKSCKKKGGTCASKCPVGYSAEEGCRGKSCVCCIKQKVSECICGQANPYRVVGGEVVYPKNKYPWHVWIKEGKNYLCGGSIINDRYILTAAHCLINFNCAPMGPNKFKVVVADHNIDSSSENVAATSTVSVDKVIVHPGYNCNELAEDDDIGLLRLSQSLDLTAKQVTPICLPSDDSQLYLGDMAIVTGWGYTVGSGQDQVLASLLHEVELPVVQCPSFEDYGEELTSEMICAGESDGGLDACNGDSGGPLIVQENSSAPPRFVQVGIVSFGPAACKGPGVYTRVSKYLNWIKENTKQGITCS
ncbi:unnamed protein product [Meganyctiphanes norvegica]|uniref:limulus clotting factor C n=1 Tax=Meganyctiphanes norvegica TaxID=48144 RepID=A0AAV2R958_MEGNR